MPPTANPTLEEYAAICVSGRDDTLFNAEIGGVDTVTYCRSHVDSAGFAVYVAETSPRKLEMRMDANGHQYAIWHSETPQIEAAQPLAFCGWGKDRDPANVVQCSSNWWVENSDGGFAPDPDLISVSCACEPTVSPTTAEPTVPTTTPSCTASADSNCMDIDLWINDKCSGLSPFGFDAILDARCRLVESDMVDFWYYGAQIEGEPGRFTFSFCGDCDCSNCTLWQDQTFNTCVLDPLAPDSKVSYSFHGDAEAFVSHPHNYKVTGCPTEQPTMEPTIEPTFEPSSEPSRGVSILLL